MYRRKLSALNYPNLDKFDPNVSNQFRQLIVWLEENKIKKSTPDLTNNLKNINSNEWETYFNKYKQQLLYPLQTNVPLEILDWFINYAVTMEYISNKNVYEKHVVENIRKDTAPDVIAANPLDKLDYNSTAFTSGLKTLSEMLNVTIHPNPFVTLKAISKIICQRLNNYALEHPNEFILRGKPFPIEDTSGFKLDDVSLRRAADILRLLYIHDLRDLQTKCNELIVSVQSITANPKTDTKLGKVGI